MKRLTIALMFTVFAGACANGSPTTSAPNDAAADGATGCTGCGSNQMCCNNQCVDVSSSEAHCGACGNACPANQTCTSGACRCMGQTCANGTTCCPGVGCVNTNDSLAHCGACGNACAAGQTCVNGTCALSTCNNNQNCESLQVCANATSCQCGSTVAPGRNACPAGQVCVNGPGSTDASLRRCVNLQTDPGNCGAPGNTCSGATPNCCAGRCTNTQTDAMNCGSCGNAVEMMRANRCVAGQPVCGSRTNQCPVTVLGCRCQAPLFDPNDPLGTPGPEAFTCTAVGVGGCLL